MQTIAFCQQVSAFCSSMNMHIFERKKLRTLHAQQTAASAASKGL
jgi:hypothetical protein